MSHYLLSVFHAPGVQAAGDTYVDETAMAEAFARVDAFNAMLGSRMLFAGGLTPVQEAVTFDAGQELAGAASSGGSMDMGGFWIIDAPDDAEARTLARQAAAACGQRVELRKLQG